METKVELRIRKAQNGFIVEKGNGAEFVSMGSSGCLEIELATISAAIEDLKKGDRFKVVIQTQRNPE